MKRTSTDNQNKKNQQKGKNAQNVLILALCLGCILFDFFEFPILKNAERNRLLNQSLGLSLGWLGVLLLLCRWNIKLLQKPYFSVSIIVGLIIAVNNFPFFSYFSGNMRFIRKELFDVVLFAFYCLSVGFLEEFLFRGLIFACLADIFPKNKKGLLQTFFVSSVLFGVSHLFNLFSGADVGATFLQIGYSVLTGGLFAFVLIKTKNLFFPALLHAVYNFCGLLLSKQGLGGGVVFDVPTVMITAILAVLAGIYVLYGLFHIQEGERSVLYKRLGIKNE